MPPQQTNITSEAEGLPVELVSTWSIPGLLARYWRALQDWRWRQGPKRHSGGKQTPSSAV